MPEEEAEPGRDPLTIDMLEEISGAVLNEKLVSLSVLQCQQCSGKLVPPIMLVKDVGNVCGSCKDKFDDALSIHNTPLEAMLENLVIPCRYSLKGCNEKLNYSYILMHELICGYRKCECPLQLMEACTWQGSLAFLKNHFSEKHACLLQVQNDSEFKIDVDTSKAVEIIQLLCNPNDNFIMRIRYDREECRLRFIVYFIKKHEKSSDFIYTVELDKYGFSSNKAFNNVIYQEMDVPAVFDTNKSLNIDLSDIKHTFAKSSTIRVFIKIDNETEDMQKKVDEKVLKIFECPVCNHFMKPPIALCVNGHSLCNRCKLKSKICPTCRGHFSNARNCALERFSSGLYFPCMYRDQGCHIILKGAEIVQHESECNFQFLSCPINNTCKWKGIYSEIENHLKMHPNIEVIPSNYHLKFIDLSNVEKISNSYYMTVHKHVFHVYNTYSRAKLSVCWFVEPYGLDGNVRTYKYEVGIIDGINDDKGFLQTKTCSGWAINKTSPRARSIVIPLTTLRKFANNDKCATYCKITKIVNKDQRKTLHMWLSK